MARTVTKTKQVGEYGISVTVTRGVKQPYTKIASTDYTITKNGKPCEDRIPPDVIDQMHDVMIDALRLAEEDTAWRTLEHITRQEARQERRDEWRQEEAEARESRRQEESDYE